VIFPSLGRRSVALLPFFIVNGRPLFFFLAPSLALETEIYISVFPVFSYCASVLLFELRTVRCSLIVLRSSGRPTSFGSHLWSFRLFFQVQIPSLFLILCATSLRLGFSSTPPSGLFCFSNFFPLTADLSAPPSSKLSLPTERILHPAMYDQKLFPFHFLRSSRRTASFSYPPTGPPFPANIVFFWSRLRHLFPSGF